MKIVFHYKSHLLRPKSHKRCPPKNHDLKISEIDILLKILRHIIPTFWFFCQSPTHKHDWVKKSACEGIISILLYFTAKWHSYLKIQSPFYPLSSIWYIILTTWSQHLNILTSLTTLTIQPINQINCPNPLQLPRVIIYESVQLVLFVIADTRRSRS